MGCVILDLLLSVSNHGISHFWTILTAVTTVTNCQEFNGHSPWFIKTLDKPLGNCVTIKITYVTCNYIVS